MNDDKEKQVIVVVRPIVSLIKRMAIIARQSGAIINWSKKGAEVSVDGSLHAVLQAVNLILGLVEDDPQQQRVAITICSSSK